MPQHDIQFLIDSVIKARSTLSDVLYEEMAQEAIKLGLDEIVITQFGNLYTVDGKIVVASNQSFDYMNKLDIAYCDYVHDGGCDEPVWTKEKGWH